MKTLTTTVDGAEVRWRDKKRYLWVLGLIVPLLPFGAANWVRDSGWTGFYFAGPVFILVIIPLLDWAFGTDRSNPPDWAVEQLAEDDARNHDPVGNRDVGVPAAGATPVAVGIGIEHDDQVHSSGSVRWRSCAPTPG